MEKIQTILQDDFGFLPEWLIGVGVVAFAILCALIAHRLLVSLAKRAIGPKRSVAIQILAEQCAHALVCGCFDRTGRLDIDPLGRSHCRALPAAVPRRHRGKSPGAQAPDAGARVQAFSAWRMCRPCDRAMK